MEIETQMAADRERAAEMASEVAEKEAAKRKNESGTATVGIRTAVRKQTGTKKGGSVVKRPPTKRVGRGF